MGLQAVPHQGSGHPGAQAVELGSAQGKAVAAGVHRELPAGRGDLLPEAVPLGPTLQVGRQGCGRRGIAVSEGRQCVADRQSADQTLGQPRHAEWIQAREFPWLGHPPAGALLIVHPQLLPTHP